MKKILFTSIAYLLITLFSVSSVRAQSIATFTSVDPVGQTQNLVIPSTHTFQRIIRSGSALTAGGNLGSNPDFTGYVAINGSSTNGYLSISSETAPAECAILSMTYNNANKLWNITSSGKVDFPGAEIGYCAAFCSGTVTPKNTIMVCEEVAPNGDGNADGYDDLGWIIEIDPATRTVINQDANAGADKLWAMGRQAHENVAIKSDQTVAYWGADNSNDGFLYKFIPTVAGNFSAGTLYVLETTGALGTGTWKQILNTTKAERNNVVAASNAAGAYNFQRIEDVEIGPDGRVYFASTQTGRVLRLTDNGTTVSNLAVFVDNATYDIDGPGPYAPVKFEWPDNLAFDGEGNLWILQDGGDNHIWVVAPTHTSATPAIKVFGNTPAGSEPTGITFSPDFRFMFLSIQHPSGSNTVTQTDAAGNNVAFDTHTTLVIARKENLGVITLPVHYTSIDLLQKSNGVEVKWTAVGANSNSIFEIERSTDGVNFTKVGATQSSQSNSGSYNYMDMSLPQVAKIYYRIKQCDNAGNCTYSETKLLRITSTVPAIKVINVSRGIIHVNYSSPATSNLSIKIYNNNGSEIYREQRTANAGVNDFNMVIKNLPKGIYVLKMEDASNKISRSFVND